MENLSRKIHSSQFVKIHKVLNGKIDTEFSHKINNSITDKLQMSAVKIIFGSLNIQLLKELKKKNGKF